jgi:hypothetical protein
MPEFLRVPSSGFLRVNNHITSVWGAGFTFIGVSLAICGAVDAPACTGMAGLVGPAIFTKVRLARAQARLLAQAQAPATASPQQAVPSTPLPRPRTSDSPSHEGVGPS